MDAKEYVKIREDGIDLEDNTISKAVEALESSEEAGVLAKHAQRCILAISSYKLRSRIKKSRNHPTAIPTMAAEIVAGMLYRRAYQLAEDIKKYDEADRNVRRLEEGIKYKLEIRESKRRVK